MPQMAYFISYFVTSSVDSPVLRRPAFSLKSTSSEVKYFNFRTLNETLDNTHGWAVHALCFDRIFGKKMTKIDAKR